MPEQTDLLVCKITYLYTGKCKWFLTLMEVLTHDVALNAHPLYPGCKKEKEMLVMEL